MAASKEARRGLLLTLPGAPEEPHIVCSPDTGQPVPGHYHPVIPTPVGSPGELPLAVAERWAKDPRYHLRLVTLSDVDADRWAAWWRAIRPELRTGAAVAARTAEGGEQTRVADSLAAIEQEA